MDSSSASRTQTFCPNKAQEFLHLSALNSFAIVQPILDSLINNVAFLRYYDYSTAAVMLVVALLTIAVPVSVLVLRLVLNQLGFSTFARAIRSGVMVILFLLATLYATRWGSSVLRLYGFMLPDELFFVPAILISGWLTRYYVRAEMFRQFLSVSAVGVILFPAAFFMNAAIQEQVLKVPAREYYQPVTARSPVPVIFLVLDGLNGMALLDEDHLVDRARFPSFARLADRCSFYRNASTVHTRTDHALPAILSGSYPTGTQRPLESEYPLNLFRLLDNSRQFEQTIFEPYTQLTPQHLQRIVRHDSTLRQACDLMETVLRVYERLCLPHAMDSLAVDIPREWFRMLPPASADSAVLSGKIMYPWDTDHSLQVDHFLKCLRSSEQPALRFFHIALPHDPWTRLSSGQQYRRVDVGLDPIPGDLEGVWCGDEWFVNLGWQRYLLQAQYADFCLGRILDRLEEQGLFEESMIIVTADHGFAFRAGCSRREPQGETLADLIPVPLFIKYPQQKEAMISDRNVETVDILPTIAEVLGLPRDPNWDGDSLLSADPERPRKTVIGNRANIVLEPGFQVRFDYVDRLHNIFGKGSTGTFANLQSLPELMDVEASSLMSTAHSEFRLRLSEGRLPDVAGGQGLIPCYYCGQLVGLAPKDKPVFLAVAVNGKIQGTTRTSTAPENFGEWAILLPPGAFSAATDRVQFFVVEQTSGVTRLHELSLE